LRAPLAGDALAGPLARCGGIFGLTAKPMRSHPRELFRRAHGSAPVVVDAIVADLLTELNSERPRQPVRRRWRFENGFELIGVGRYK